MGVARRMRFQCGSSVRSNGAAVAYEACSDPTLFQQAERLSRQLLDGCTPFRGP